MAYTRRKTSDDATWQRAWTADTLADLATISGILGSERPHHGDIAFVTADSNYYLWLDNGSWAQITGLNAGSTSQSIILGMDGIDGNDGFTIPGPAGPTGPAGATGSTGLQGPMFFAEDGIDGLDGFPRTPDLSNVALLSASNVFTNTGSQSLSGPLDISAATSGQIKFPVVQNSSANVNTLDDYEEGTWTPTDSSGAGLSFLSASGSYVKIGRLVILSWALQYPTNSNGLVALIGGFPFTVSAESAFAPGFVSASAPIYLYVPASNSIMEPLTQAGGVNMTNSGMSHASFGGGGTYFTTT